MSRSAVSQHLRLMLAVGVVAERRDGRERYYSLRRDGLIEVDRWLAELDDFWTRSLQRLAVATRSSTFGSSLLRIRVVLALHAS